MYFLQPDVAYSVVHIRDGARGLSISNSVSGIAGNPIIDARPNLECLPKFTMIGTLKNTSKESISSQLTHGIDVVINNFVKGPRVLVNVDCPVTTNPHLPNRYGS